MTTKQKPGDRVLSVREAVEYLDKWNSHPSEYSSYTHFIGEGKVRRCLSKGFWPSTRTASGHMGITLRDLRAAYNPKRPRLTKAQRAANQKSKERF
jgi:hypothetical protein